MTDSKTFHLPDLGEGLPDATIVEWFVKEGDVIRLDEPLVSMETAKAVVEVPSPVSGKVLKLAGNAGDIVVTGSMLAEASLTGLPSARQQENRPRTPPQPQLPLRRVSAPSARQHPRRNRSRSARPNAMTQHRGGAMQSSKVHQEQASRSAASGNSAVRAPKKIAWILGARCSGPAPMAL